MHEKGVFEKILLFIFRERGREGEREGEKHDCVVASPAPPTGDQDGNPGLCPDLNRNRDSLVPRPALHPLSHTSQGILLKDIVMIYNIQVYLLGIL